MTVALTDPDKDPLAPLEGFEDPEEARITRIILTLLSAAGDEGLEEELLLRLTSGVGELIEFEVNEAKKSD